MAEFNPEMEVVDTKWIVENLIPSGHLCVFLAQAGVGKSLVVESLGVHVSCGVDFCGYKTITSDVLIIDQDTPTAVLEKRLAKFHKGIKSLQDPTKIRGKLFYESMNGYTLDNGTIYTLIKDHETCKLIIIDSFHSICGKLNTNLISDVNSAIVKLKNNCLMDDRTIIINHHISEKIPDSSVEYLMTENPHGLAMGSSALIQQVDTYYIIGATAENGFTNKIFIRPVPKRASVSSKPKILKIVQPEVNAERLEFDGEWSNEKLTDEENDILTFMKSDPRDRSVLEIYQQMGHAHGEIAIRKALKSLNQKNLVVLSKHRSNLFKYRLP